MQIETPSFVSIYNMITKQLQIQLKFRFNLWTLRTKINNLRATILVMNSGFSYSESCL